MTAIVPVPPIDSALHAVAANAGAHGAGAADASLRDKFQALMHRTEDASPGRSSEGAGRAVGHFLQAGQGQIDAVHDELERLSQEMPTMSPQEAMAASASMVEKISLMNMGMNVGTGLTQGMQKSLQTLIKNQ